MDVPRHCQLMAPADDPQEYIESSIYWYPLLFPTRTEVLDHTFLVSGIGYEWGSDGNLHSVFAHIEPEYDRWYSYEADAAKYEALALTAETRGGRDLLLSYAAEERAEDARLRAIRADYRRLARTYGPVRDTEQVPGPGNGHLRQARTVTSRDLSWTLLGRMPANVAPAWRQVADEARELFAAVLTEQGALF